MAVDTQRFCPVCDAAFTHGEAVVRCEGCGVLSHTTCWNRNEGCPTTAPHDERAVAIAYGITAVVPPPPVEPARLEIPPAPDSSQRTPRARHQPPYPAGYVPPSPQEPPPGRERLRRTPLEPQLPKLYRGPAAWLRFWYVPAAALLTAAIAFGIVLGVDRLFPEEDSQLEPADETTVISQTPLPTVQATPTPSPTPDPDGTPAPTPEQTGAFAQGQGVTVTGTGDCLNMRATPAIDGEVIACLPDGTALTISGGPESGGGRTWWNVSSPSGVGWVAEEYLVAR